MPVRLKRLDGAYAISQLAPDAPLPDWLEGEGFVSVTRTDEEVSIVCRQERVPAGVRADPDWLAFQLIGPFAFDETGIVLSVIRPLSENAIGVFVLSTFNGDLLLVKQADQAKAESLLTQAGHQLL